MEWRRQKKESSAETMVVKSKHAIAASVEVGSNMSVAPAVLSKTVKQEHQRSCGVQGGGGIEGPNETGVWLRQGGRIALGCFSCGGKPAAREDLLVAFVHKEAFLLCHPSYGR